MCLSLVPLCRTSFYHDANVLQCLWLCPFICICFWGCLGVKNMLERSLAKIGAMWPISSSVCPQRLCPISLTHRVAHVPFKPKPRRVGACLAVFQLFLKPRPRTPLPHTHFLSPGSQEPALLIAGVPAPTLARSGMRRSSWDERMAGLGCTHKAPHPSCEDLQALV